MPGLVRCQAVRLLVPLMPLTADQARICHSDHPRRFGIAPSGLADGRFAVLNQRQDHSEAGRVAVGLQGEMSLSWMGKREGRMSPRIRVRD